MVPFICLMAVSGIHQLRERQKECFDTESNYGPSDLQSDALPTELSKPRWQSAMACTYTLKAACHLTSQRTYPPRVPPRARTTVLTKVWSTTIRYRTDCTGMVLTVPYLVRRILRTYVLRARKDRWILATRNPIQRPTTGVRQPSAITQTRGCQRTTHRNRTAVMNARRHHLRCATSITGIPSLLLSSLASHPSTAHAATLTIVVGHPSHQQVHTKPR